jgi:hypothetical protein
MRCNILLKMAVGTTTIGIARAMMGMTNTSIGKTLF